MTKPAPTKKGTSKNSMNKMLCLDVYLNELSPEAYEQVKGMIRKNERINYPLLCWDLFSMHLHDIKHKPNDKRRTH